MHGWQRSRTLVIAIGAAIACLASAGCGRQTAGIVRRQVSAFSGCPERAIRVRHGEGPLWYAEGCGARRAAYLCWSERGVGFSCTPAPARTIATVHPGGAPAATVPPPPAPVAVDVPTEGGENPATTREWTPAVADAVGRSLTEGVRACVIPPAAITLTVVVGRDGRVTSVAGIEHLRIEQQICVASAAQTVRVPGGLRRPGHATFDFR